MISLYDLAKSFRHELVLDLNYRWNTDAAEQLPSYMKQVYNALLEVHNEVEKELVKENKSFHVNYALVAVIICY